MKRLCSKVVFACGALVVFLSTTQNANANLIFNGGFETGEYQVSWSPTGNDGTTVTGDPFYVHSGTQGLSAGPVGAPVTISQTFANIAATYTVGLWFKSTVGSNIGFLQIDFGGVNLATLTNPSATVDNLNNDFIHLVYTGVSGGGGLTTTLALTFQNVSDFYGIDDISVDEEVAAVTPEPSSLALLGLGAFGALVGARRRRQQGNPVLA